MCEIQDQSLCETENRYEFLIHIPQLGQMRNPYALNVTQVLP